MTNETLGVLIVRNGFKMPFNFVFFRVTLNGCPVRQSNIFENYCNNFENHLFQKDRF